MEPVLVVSSICLWIILAINILLTLALIKRFNSFTKNNSEAKSLDGIDYNSGLAEGIDAPYFEGISIEGEKVTIEKYQGQPTAFIFFSTTCPPCRRELPTYQALGAKAARAGTNIVLVSLSSLDKTKEFVEEQKITLPVIVAPIENNNFAKNYNSTSTPSYCMLDAQGKVKSAGYPSLDWGAWKSLASSWEIGDSNLVLK